MWKRVLVFVGVAAILAAGLWYSQVRPREEKVSGFIEVHDVRVGSRGGGRIGGGLGGGGVGGRIARVLVVEGQRVKARELLVELEPFDLEERLREAHATLGRRDI